MIRPPSLPARLPAKALAVASVVLLGAVSLRPSFADWLVTRDGHLIETLGPWIRGA